MKFHYRFSLFLWHCIILLLLSQGLQFFYIYYVLSLSDLQTFPWFKKICTAILILRISIFNKQMVPWNDIFSCWWLLAFDLSFFSCVLNVSYFNTLTYQIIYIFTQCVWAWLTRQIKWFNKINNLSKSIIASIKFDIIFACQSASLISWHIPKDL